MPFDRQGIWTAPTEADLAAYKDSILNPVEEAQNLPDHIAAQLQQQLELQNKFNSNKIIAEANKKTYSSVSSALKNGVGEVDIVIPVYGSLNAVKACVESVIERTNWPYNLIVVDDCSDDMTRGWVYDLQQRKDIKITVKLNNKNKGFAATVNRGIKAGNGKYVCVLNSDVVVTENWLTKLVLAIEADERNQIVNPATNNTALINLPIQDGESYISMNRALERTSPRRYPEIMPTGFCFMFRRSLVDEVGVLDEGFEGGYGEETSYWMNVIKYKDESGHFPRYRAVMADDTFVFHERGSSFSQLGTDKHMSYRRAGNERFHKMHPDFKEWQKGYDVNSAIAPMRQEMPPNAFQNTYDYNIAWIVHSTEFCGGMKYITDIVNYLIENNVNARVVCVANDIENPPGFPAELRTQPIFFSSIDDLLVNFSTRVFSEGTVVAATAHITSTVKSLTEKYSNLIGIHHAQSYDPALTEDAELKKAAAEGIGVLPYTVTVSNWVADMLKKKHGVNAPVIWPGVDNDVFYPRDRERGDDRFTVMISLLKNYPFKGYTRGIELCNLLQAKAKQMNKDIRIFAIGTDKVDECKNIIALGNVSQSRLATLLGSEVDVFVDPSEMHSYGMPALEAMASGCAVACWNNKGVEEYALKSDADFIVLPNNSPAQFMADKILQLKRSDGIIPTGHYRSSSVKDFKEYLDNIIKEETEPKDIVIINPHLRKHGGPTTIINLGNIAHYIGHKVTMPIIYTDFNPEVLSFVDNKIDLMFDYKRVPESDLLICNSDNPYADYYASLPQVKHKILLKLSHNARFKALEEKSLNQDWDRIITSSEWLRQACLSQMEGWSHKEWPADKVTRIGWYHYSHPIFNAHPQNRTYGLKEQAVNIGTLIHEHPLKGTREAMATLTSLKRLYGSSINCFGVGESRAYGRPNWLSYYYSLNRRQMAELMQQMDIWLVASHTEGLGRMALEAMSAGCAIVASDTGAEFLTNEENALLYPVTDSKAAADSVIKLVEDKELFTKIVFQGYNTAVNASNPNPYIENIARVIREVTSER